jgi:hypothetical protein
MVVDAVILSDSIAGAYPKSLISITLSNYIDVPPVIGEPKISVLLQDSLHT